MLHFRRALTVRSVPASYVVRVSADNRFILWVNGKRVGDGPARGDLGHWRYRSFDLAPLLKPGENLITATVWNWGVFAPVAQMSDRTAFLLESEVTGAISHQHPRGLDGRGRTPATARSTAHPSLSRITSLPAPAKKSTRRSTTGAGSTHGAAGGHWVKPGDPMRDSIFPGTSTKRIPSDTTGDNFWGLVPDAPAAHGILAHRVREDRETGLG